MEAAAVTFLALSTVYWILVLRYYHNLSLELSQYAEPPLKSPTVRTALVAIYGFGLTFSFALTSLSSETSLSSAFRTSSGSLTLAFFVVLFSFFSPLVNYLSIYTQFTNSADTFFTPASFLLAIAYAIIFFIPLGYVFYKTRKEIEIRFQMATGGLPKKLREGFKMYRVSHGKPVVRGFFGAISGVILFPWYLYFDLFKAKQGVVVYRKVTTTEYDWTSHPPPLYVRDERLTVDVEEELAKTDKAAMNHSEIPRCTKCKKPLIYLKDHEKWWCTKCKRAYVDYD
jgi:hypothetical protein